MVWKALPSADTDETSGFVRWRWGYQGRIDTERIAAALPSWLARRDPSEVAETIGQVGWVARGISYLVLGVITLRLVFGTGNRPEDADQAGALEAVAEAPGGTALLALLAVGLAIFALWQVAQLVGLSGSDLDSWLGRVSKLIGIAFYGSLVLNSIELLRRGFSSESSLTVERLSAWALGFPVGRLVVVGAGVGVVLVSARRSRRSVTGDLDDDLELGRAGEREGLVVEWLGRVGEIGRAVSFLLVGWFLVYAGAAGQSDAAGGLDRSLARAARSSFGSVLVVITGVGFVLYGAYSVASARHRSLNLTDQ